MSFLFWIAMAGGLLLIMAFAAAFLERQPVTSSIIYLTIGLAVSPAGLDLIRIDFLREKVVFEHLTEIAVIISLFVGGLKLRLPLSDPAWTAAFRLAGPLMLASIAGVAAFVHFLLGIDWPAAVLLGAVLAPTDPVLAGMVSVNNAQDHDRLRYGLSGEAGFNDGAAFPFVVFSLLWIESPSMADWAGTWALHRLVWAVPAGLLLGYFMGWGVGRVAIHLRSRNKNTGAPGDFLALALIALSYVGAESLGAWGFLAVFAAGVGFRRSERVTAEEHPVPEHGAAMENHNSSTHPPAEDVAHSGDAAESQGHPTRTAGHLISEIVTFGDTAERLLEMILVVVLGICVSTYWDWRALPLAFALFVVIRPLCTFLFLMKSPTLPAQRLLMGWFGIRGIGSLYYLSYSLNHGAAGQADDLIGLTLSVVALSVLVHGISSPLLDFYRKGGLGGRRPLPDC